VTVNRALVQRILDIEWSMFVRVKNSSGPAPCQSAPENFQTIRGSLFESWTDAMLESYLHDLDQAKGQGRNLLTEKYARMDNLIEPVSTNPVIGAIVRIESKWHAEIRDKYPSLYERCCRKTDAEAGGNFAVYLRCVLETYGDGTLRLYHEYVESADSKGENLALNALERLVRKSGYRDVEHAEECLSK
jgi:hypothetical protein